MRLLLSNRDALDEAPVFGHVPGGGRFLAFPIPFNQLNRIPDVFCDGLLGKNVFASSQGTLDVLLLVCNGQAVTVIRSIVLQEQDMAVSLAYAMMTADMSVRFNISL